MVRAEVTSPCVIYNEPKSLGDVVEVDEITFTNLHRKGRLKHASASPMLEKHMEGEQVMARSKAQMAEAEKRGLVAKEAPKGKRKSAKAGKKFKGFR